MSTSDRALSVLNLFGDRGEWTVEEAAKQLELTISTAYRYFRSLANAGLVTAYAPSRYVLGPAIIQLDRQMRMNDPLITAAEPVMERIANDVGLNHVLLLTRLYRSMVMCVHQEFVEKPDFAVSYTRGRPIPLERGASSKVILAFLSPRILRQIKGRGDLSDTVLEKLRPELRSIRNAGYSITVSEIDSGMRGIAVPIFAPDGGVSGSLSIVARAESQSTEDIQSSLERLIHGRKAIEAALEVRAATAEFESTTKDQH